MHDDDRDARRREFHRLRKELQRERPLWWRTLENVKCRFIEPALLGLSLFRLYELECLFDEGAIDLDEVKKRLRASERESSKHRVKPEREFNRLREAEREFSRLLSDREPPLWWRTLAEWGELRPADEPVDLEDVKRRFREAFSADPRTTPSHDRVDEGLSLFRLYEIEHLYNDGEIDLDEFQRRLRAMLDAERSGEAPAE